MEARIDNFIKDQAQTIQPPGWIHTLVTAVFSGFLLGASSSPEFFTRGMVGTLNLWGFLVFICPILIPLVGVYFYRLLRLTRLNDLAPVQTASTWRWFIFPTLCLFGLSSISGWTLHARFEMSRSAFNVAVRKFQANPTMLGPQNVGLFSIHEISQTDHGREVVLFRVGEQMTIPPGFIHSPNGCFSSNWISLRDEWYWDGGSD